MQKNHLFAAILVSASIALISVAASARKAAVQPARPLPVVTADTVATTAQPAETALYETLNLEEAGLSREAFDYALQGYEKLVAEGKATNEQYLTIIDFSQSSRKKRFYLVDVQNGRLLINTFVS